MTGFPVFVGTVLHRNGQAFAVHAKSEPTDQERDGVFHLLTGWANGGFAPAIGPNYLVVPVVAKPCAYEERSGELVARYEAATPEELARVVAAGQPPAPEPFNLYLRPGAADLCAKLGIPVPSVPEKPVEPPPDPEAPGGEIDPPAFRCRLCKDRGTVWTGAGRVGTDGALQVTTKPCPKCKPAPASPAPAAGPPPLPEGAGRGPPAFRCACCRDERFVLQSVPMRRAPRSVPCPQCGPML